MPGFPLLLSVFLLSEGQVQLGHMPNSFAELKQKKYDRLAFLALPEYPPPLDSRLRFRPGSPWALQMGTKRTQNELRV